MKLKIKCINALGPSGPPSIRQIGLRLGKVYTVTKLIKKIDNGAERIWQSRAEAVELKELPGRQFYARRFKILGKKIVITLPNDFEIFSL